MDHKQYWMNNPLVKKYIFRILKPWMFHKLFSQHTALFCIQHTADECTLCLLPFHNTTRGREWVAFQKASALHITFPPYFPFLSWTEVKQISLDKGHWESATAPQQTEVTVHHGETVCKKDTTEYSGSQSSSDYYQNKTTHHSDIYITLNYH